MMHFLSVGSEDFVCLYHHSKPVKHFHTTFTTLRYLYYYCSKHITHFLGNWIIIYSEIVRVPAKKSYQFDHLLVRNVSVIHHWNSSYWEISLPQYLNSTIFAGCISCIQAYSKISFWWNAQGGDVCLGIHSTKPMCFILPGFSQFFVSHAAILHDCLYSTFLKAHQKEATRSRNSRHCNILSV